VLNNKLGAVSNEKQLRGVRTAADALSDEVIRAQGAVDETDADSAAKDLLSEALAAHLAYARKVSRAAQTLTEATAGAVGDAAEQAKDAYSSVAAKDSDLAVPETSSFAQVRLLKTLASKLSAKDSSTAAIRLYVRSIDSLLRNSVEARADLGALISEAESGTIGYSEARDRIAGVITQRTSLQTEVAALSPPTPFVGAAELLRRSITASLDDDRAIQGLINAYFEGYDPSSFLDRHAEANSRATDAKSRFLVSYNRLRARYLKLPGLPLDMRY
jgi:hypothetical protein